MSNNFSEEIKRYAFNLFSFPDGYFEEHTAEELEISEEARQWLIETQKKCSSED